MFHNTLLEEIKNILSTIEIKFEKQAKKSETLESRRDADMYIAASTNNDSFISYPHYDREALESAGILDVELLEECLKDKHKIPLDMRQKVLIQQRKIVIRDYVEKNNYYRSLHGLPDIEDTDYIYIDSETCKKFNIDPTIPIHELSIEKANVLNTLGYTEQILERNPDKKYLKFLGLNKIDIVTARTANNFAIIRINSAIHEALYTEFISLYESSREYFMTVLYIKEYSKQYDLYDNFMGLCIMIMTIQRLVVSMFKSTIEHDFIDWGSIQTVFKAYSIPFIKNLPMEYQRLLLKNINILLRRKSTDKVLFDICSLLGYERLKIFKYFLMKQHKLDNDENPLFVYKTIQDEEGNNIIVEDKHKMYELYFQKVAIDERNLALALVDTKNKVRYNEVIDHDPYWWEDEGIRDRLLQEEFTYIETKYISITMVRKMTEMLFEIMYAFRMIIDKKEEIENIYLEIPRIIYKGKFKLFNIVAFLCALMCKRCNFKGNIITTFSKTLGVYGFDFKEDFDKIRQIILDNKDHVDQDLLDRLNNMTIIRPEDVNRVYNVIKDFNDYIIDKMYRAKNVKEYRAYRTIFQALMVSEASREMFKMSNGEEAETFMEYLKDQDYLLYEIVNKAEVDNISSMVDHILVKINELMVDLKYLYILNDTTSPVFQAIVALIMFFKSYTVDITSLNIIYLFDCRYYNTIKLMGDLHTLLVEFSLDDNLKLLYADSIKELGITMNGKDILLTKDFFEFFSNLLLPPDILWINEEIHRLSKELETKDILPLKEKISLHTTIEYIIVILMIKEKWQSFNVRIETSDDIHMIENIIDFNKVLEIVQRIRLQYADSINKVDTVLDRIEDSLKLREHYSSLDLFLSIYDVFDFITSVQTFHKDLYLDETFLSLISLIEEMIVKLYIQSVYQKMDDVISMSSNIVLEECVDMNEIIHMKTSIKLIEMIKLQYSDIIESYLIKWGHKDNLNLKEYFSDLDIRIPLDHMMFINDKITSMHISFKNIDRLLYEYREKLLMNTNIPIDDVMELKDRIEVLSLFIHKERCTLKDYINMQKHLTYIETLRLKYSDELLMSKEIRDKLILRLVDSHKHFIRLMHQDVLELRDILFIKMNALLISNIDLIDGILYTTNIPLDSIFNLKDYERIITRLYYDEEISFKDYHAINTLVSCADNLYQKYADILQLSKEFDLETNLAIRDASWTLVNLRDIEILTIEDKHNISRVIARLTSVLENKDKIEYSIYVDTQTIVVIKDLINTLSRILTDDSLDFIVSVGIEQQLPVIEKILTSYADRIYNIKDLELRASYRLRDETRLIFTYLFLSTMNFKDKHNLKSYLHTNEAYKLSFDIKSLYFTIDYTDMDLSMIDDVYTTLLTNYRDHIDIRDKHNISTVIDSFDTISFSVKLNNIANRVVFRDKNKYLDSVDLLCNIKYNLELLNAIDDTSMDLCLDLVERLKLLYNTDVFLNKVFKMSSCNIKFMTAYLSYYKTIIVSSYTLTDKIHSTITNIFKIDNSKYKDDIVINNKATIDAIQWFKDNHETKAAAFVNSRLFTEEAFKVFNTMNLTDRIMSLYNDLVNIECHLTYNEKLSCRDSLFIIRED